MQRHKLRGTQPRKLDIEFGIQGVGVERGRSMTLGNCKMIVMRILVRGETEPWRGYPMPYPSIPNPKREDTLTLDLKPYTLEYLTPRPKSLNPKARKCLTLDVGPDEDRHREHEEMMLERGDDPNALLLPGVSGFG